MKLLCCWTRAVGPERLFACVRSSCAASSRRGGRYPVWAHDGAVGAAHRLRCGARSGLAPRNSLHSLRSLRSDSLGESDERSALRAPSPALALQAAQGLAALPLARHGQSTGLSVSGLACSPPQKSPPPGTAHRAATRVVFLGEYLGASGKAAGGCASAATYAALRNAGLVVARVSALRSSDSSRLFERSERSERSEFRDGPRDRVPEGSRPAGPAAAFERRRIPARGFAYARCPHVAKRSIPTAAQGRVRPFDHMDFTCRGPREARWSN
jgi:hypothetical protein